MIAQTLIDINHNTKKYRDTESHWRSSLDGYKRFKLVIPLLLQTVAPSVEENGYYMHVTQNDG